MLLFQLVNKKNSKGRGDIINIKESTVINFYYKEEMVHKLQNVKIKMLFFKTENKG